jgi:hypothetical protein
MNMIMVNASMFPSTSFGIPWSSSENGKSALYCSDWEPLPIEPACETKLFSICENALHDLISHKQQNPSNFIGRVK